MSWLSIEERQRFSAVTETEKHAFCVKIRKRMKLPAQNVSDLVGSYVDGTGSKARLVLRIEDGSNFQTADIALNLEQAKHYLETIKNSIAVLEVLCVAQTPINELNQASSLTHDREL